MLPVAINCRLKKGESFIKFISELNNPNSDLEPVTTQILNSFLPFYGFVNLIISIRNFSNYLIPKYCRNPITNSLL